MYGLSLTASLLCASATRRFASATLLARSSCVEGVPGAGDAAAVVEGVGPLETVGDGEATTCGTGSEGLTGTGAITIGGLITVLFFIAASFAAISARFCAIRSAPVSYIEATDKQSCFPLRKKKARKNLPLK